MIRVNGDPMAWQEGLTVSEVLTAKKYVFPLLVISINGDLIDRKDYPTTTIPDGADVKVIHMLSGG